MRYYMKKWILILILFISQGAWALDPGDDVFVEGEFREQLIPTDSGELDNPITYQGIGTGAYILVSMDADKEDSWTAEGGNIHSSPLPVGTPDVGDVYLDTELDESLYLFGDKKTNFGCGPSGTMLVNDYDFCLSIDGGTPAGDGNLYMFDSGDGPSTDFTGIEVAISKETGGNEAIIQNNGKDYLVFKNLNVKFGALHGINNYGNTIGVEVDGCNISYVGGKFNTSGVRYGNGIQYYNRVEKAKVNNCSFKQNYDEAITAQITTGTGVIFDDIDFSDNTIDKCSSGITILNYSTACSNSNITISRNTITNVNQGRGGTGSAAERYGIHFRIYSPVQNVLIADNDINGGTCDGIRLYSYPMTVTRNRVNNVASEGFRLEDINGSSPSFGGLFFLNIATNNGYADGTPINARIDTTATYGTGIYNNIFYSTVSRAFYSDHAANTTIKNNIFYSTFSYAMNTAPTSEAFDYNLYYRPSGALIRWNSVDYNTLAAYQAASGQDSHSIAADPLFRNAAGGDFRLKWGSPCINIGTNLGDDYDMAFDPHDTTWPYATIDQDFFGPWEIGAYVYRRRLEVATRSWDQYLKMGIGLDLDMLMYSIVDGNVF